MDTIAASASQLEAVVADTTDASPDRAQEDLAAAVLRAPSVEEAFVLVRRVYPLGMSPPPDVRRALFSRSANDHVLAKVLLFGARRDEDLVQEVLAWWWETGLDAYDPARSAVRTYLNQVIFNRLANEGRKSKRRGRHHARVSDDDVAQVCDRLCGAADLDAFLLLSDLLEGIPSNEAMVWALAAISGHTNAEIATIAKVPLGSVSRIVVRVRERLEARYASRNPCLLALVPATMLQRPSVMERAADLLGGVRAAARGALATVGGKVISYAAVAGVSAGIAASVAPRREVRVAVRPPVVAPVAPAADAPRSAQPVPVSAPVAPALPSPPVASAPRVARAGDRAEEAAELEHASAVVASRPSTALSLVASHRRRWPRSALANTRDAVEAEALNALGQGDRARAIAARIIARSPQGPEAFRMRQLGLAAP